LGHGLVGMVVLGGWLDLMILEVFSNLWFYDLFNGHRWDWRCCDGEPMWGVTQRLREHGHDRGALRAGCFLVEVVISAGSPALCVSPLSNAPVGVCRGGSVTGWMPTTGQNQL